MGLRLSRALPGAVPPPPEEGVLLVSLSEALRRVGELSIFLEFGRCGI